MLVPLVHSLFRHMQSRPSKLQLFYNEPYYVVSFERSTGPLSQHDRLDLNKRTFPLLRILPNLESDIIQCDLTTADFTSEYEGAYNALSYEWGPEEPPFYWIRLNDGYLHIRQNLHNFFHMARRKAQIEPNLTSYLWIDAIRINQQDLLERGH